MVRICISTVHLHKVVHDTSYMHLSKGIFLSFWAVNAGPPASLGAKVSVGMGAQTITELRELDSIESMSAVSS